ncbi:MAG: phosphodiesterase [Mesorhizobium sp.]|uniref:putative bifunctional diguanylate cyclase/phosphodiesterase n=1 Tax=Mesorhizobium sp. TaxID=1871066 RepID=UPI000FE8EA38|nr:EAL domain-containing protein [Mesorhizobium sp.]RWM02699.1 MAG: phosphodiesterase [Mesorhizobium sp.]
MPEHLQQAVLDMIAKGRSIEETAAHICLYAEDLSADTLCSIITIDREGIIHPLAGPNLSSDYSSALDGIPIGPNVGSCGTAAFLRTPVAVQDIFTDPLWVPYQALAGILARDHSVKACWSSPIMQSDGRVLGAFGFYYREHRGPTDEEWLIVNRCVDLCSLALEREEARAENQRLAYYDLLTGLGNRAHFIKALEMASNAGEDPLAILLVDIDHLGRVNDTFGHATGDEVIRSVGRTIARIAAPAKTFRVDADEFAVLIEGMSPAISLSRIASQILKATEEHSFPGEEATFSLSVSSGGALSNQSQSCQVPILLQHANLALHHAKQAARGSFVLYNDDLASTIAQRFRILQTATSALAEGRVEAHYQPIVDLSTEKTVGLEALCRVRTRDGEIISAGLLSDALQDFSMGNLLTDRMLDQVASAIKYWLEQAIPLQYVSVNVSMADFQKGSLRERISRAFARHGIPVGHVVLEVTESVYMDDSDGKVAGAIEKLRADGLLVALDDFGTGYASLTHLLNFPVDIIKIDKSFVDQMSDGGAGEIIVKAIIDMANGLAMRVIAEGVETADQAMQLKRLGCRFAQGYFFDRAADRDRTTEALRLDIPRRSFRA